MSARSSPARGCIRAPSPRSSLPRCRRAPRYSGKAALPSASYIDYSRPVSKPSAAIALAMLFAGGDSGAPQHAKPFGEVGDFEILVGQALGGASAYYLGAGGGLLTASAAGLLHVEFCFSA